MMHMDSPLLADDDDDEAEGNIARRRFDARRASTNGQTAPQALMMANTRGRAPQAPMALTTGDSRTKAQRKTKKLPARLNDRQMSVEVLVNGKTRLPPRSRNGCW